MQAQEAVEVEHSPPGAVLYIAKAQRTRWWKRVHGERYENRIDDRE